VTGTLQVIGGDQAIDAGANNGDFPGDDCHPKDPTVCGSSLSRGIHGCGHQDLAALLQAS